MAGVDRTEEVLAVSALAAELDERRAEVRDLDRRLLEEAAASARASAQSGDLARRLGLALASADEQQRRAEALQRRLDSVITTRTWRAIEFISRARVSLRRRVGAVLAAVKARLRRRG